MHIKGKNSWLKHIDFIVMNTVTLIFSFVIAYLIRFGDLGFIMNRNWKVFLIMICLINLVFVLLLNPYSGIFHRPHYDDFIKQLGLTMYSAVFSAVFFYILRTGAFYSRLVFGYTFVIYFVISFLGIYIRKRRILTGRTRPLNARANSLLVITDYDRVHETIENIYSSDIINYEITAFCFTTVYPTDEYDGKRVVKLEDLESYVLNNNIDDVFLGAEASVISPDTYKNMVNNGVTIHIDINTIIGTEVDDQFIGKIGINKTLSVGPITYDARRMIYMVVKRILDIFFALIGCILLIPIMIIVKISYLISGDTKPLLYYQTRVGQHGKIFKLYKLRSMVYNADEVLEELLRDEKYRKQWEENQKFDNDPRITKIGKFLRKTSLDEFPQFINILKGDMSLVGPRPLVPGELEEHGGLTLYNKVKPGITGWWGCNGRSKINYRERLELEYYYVRNCSFSLDLLCILRTAHAVIRRDGAQ